MKKYQDIDFEIIFFAEQDIVTASQLFDASYADEQHMNDMYGKDWLDGLN